MSPKWLGILRSNSIHSRKRRRTEAISPDKPSSSTKRSSAPIPLCTRVSQKFHHLTSPPPPSAEVPKMCVSHEGSSASSIEFRPIQWQRPFDNLSEALESRLYLHPQSLSNEDPLPRLSSALPVPDPPKLANTIALKLPLSTPTNPPPPLLIPSHGPFQFSRTPAHQPSIDDLSPTSSAPWPRSVSINDLSETDVLQLSKATAGLAMAVMKKSERNLVQERRELIDILCKTGIRSMADGIPEDLNEDPEISTAVKTFKEQLARSNILDINSDSEATRYRSVVNGPAHSKERNSCESRHEQPGFLEVEATEKKFCRDPRTWNLGKQIITFIEERRKLSEMQKEIALMRWEVAEEMIDLAITRNGRFDRGG
ncbi:hypothetical protein AOQ84DRAFT_369218 [Glonium stellatum]|uniref:Uncharacterized protein n=1 Tax=Glonium stellatum TaxID=574774 RepID=A0A8E2EQG6_9PEZI|nr:hypothetical protein AOQ84DRAFT_369218 [Glonium stellatum]